LSETIVSIAVLVSTITAVYRSSAYSNAYRAKRRIDKWQAHSRCTKR
jgi:hypothetical protein